MIACEHGRLLFYLDRPEDGLMRVREAMRLNVAFACWREPGSWRFCLQHAEMVGTVVLVVPCTAAV